MLMFDVLFAMLVLSVMLVVVIVGFCLLAFGFCVARFVWV